MDPTPLVADLRNKHEKIEAFVPEINEFKQKLEKKKNISGEVIHKQMGELHQLIDSWEQRFIDTTNETLDEKIENLTSQEKLLRSLKKQIKRFLRDYSTRRLSLKDCRALGIPIQEDDDDESSLTLEDTEDDEFAEIRQMFENVSKLQFPLKLTGVKQEEVQTDVETEVAFLLDEAQKSLKRTLTNIGGILRGYHRRGQNNDKWVQELRRLEARFETDQNISHVPILSFNQTSENETKAARNAKQVWKVISDMFHSTDGYLRDGLCKQLNALYQCFPSEVEFYLCQLLNILLHNKNFKVLADFIFDKCRESQHFATQTCFLLSAMGDHGSTRWINKCKKLLVKVEASIPADDRVKEKLELPPPEENGTVPPTPEKEKKDKKESTEGGESGIEPEMSPKIRKPFARATRRAGKDYFFQNLNFLKELVAISQKLTQKFSQPELYVSELQKNLEGLNKFIEDGVAFMPSYSTARHLVLKVNSELCYPIPTFGRVLYYLMMEVVAIPGSLVQPQGVKEYMSTLMEGNQVPDEKENSTVDGNDEYENSENTDPGLVSAFGENWIQRCKRLRTQSEFGKLLGWDSCAYIIKQGDFVLQEQFVMQMFVQFQRIFDKERVPIRLRIYRIMALSSDSGIIEVVPNALSVDKLKQQMEGGNLRNFFKQQWPDKADYNKATTNFVQSLAAYSLVCYFLQIKDRHNGNIMMDTDGNLLHIDFGYLLTRTIEFEKAPFKLTEEFIDVIGGEKSKLFQRYEELCVQGFFAIRKHYRKILTLVEMTMTQPIMGGQFLPCLNKGSVLKNLRKRFHLEDNTRIEALVKDLIKESRDNWRTNIYDAYQNILQGIRC